MDFLSPSFLLSGAVILGNFIAFLAVLDYKSKNRDKESDTLRTQIKDTEDRFKRTKSELYGRANTLDKEIVGLQRDIAHAKEGLSDNRKQLTDSISDFKAAIATSETRIMVHIDQLMTSIREGKD